MSEPLAPETKKIDLSTLPKDSSVHIHVGGEEPVYEGKVVKNDVSTRSLKTIVAGLVGSVAGFTGTKIWVNQKMFDFNTAVRAMTRKDIMGRAGIGAAFAESGIGASTPGLAAGLSTGEIHMANASTLAQAGEFGEVPKFIYKTLGGPEGATAVALAGAVVVGGAAAALAYATSEKPKPAREDKDWTDKVATDKDQTRSLT